MAMKSCCLCTVFQKGEELGGAVLLAAAPGGCGGGGVPGPPKESTRWTEEGIEGVGSRGVAGGLTRFRTIGRYFTNIWLGPGRINLLYGKLFWFGNRYAKCCGGSQAASQQVGVG